MYKGYKIRLYPTKEQENQLWQHINCCRFLWNYMLNLQKENYKNNGKFINWVEMCKMLTKIKNNDQYNWLYEVSNGSLQTICRDLDRAYKDFFKGLHGYPKFKSKKDNKKSFPLSQVKGTVYFVGNYVVIPKIKKIRYNSNYKFKQNKEEKIINPRISYINNKWILSFYIEFENQEQELNDFNMGIDLGIKELATVAVDNQRLVYHNINKSKRVKTLEHKLKHIQRVIARKYRTNGNYEKTNEIIKYEKMQKEIYNKLSNIRKNYIHQITNKLISMMPKRVTMEDLNISGMMKNKHLSKAIAEQYWYEFIRQMKYKCEWNGIEFIQADRFYPSSKTCSRCGEIKKDLKLSDRVYKCPCCGLEMDRDYNAAINLMKYESQT